MHTCPTKLQAKNISISYDGKEVLHNINLTLCQEERVALLGVSGVGKTTLFHIVAGFLKPDSGQVIVDGKLAYMQQKDLLLPHKTALDNICLPCIIRGESKAKSRSQAMEYLKRFGLEDCANKYPHQLSGGMRQRIAFLRTHMVGGDILLLDEPFSALDIATRTDLGNWFADACQSIKASVLFITHSIEEALTLGTRIYVLGGVPGQVICQVDTSDENCKEKIFQAMNNTP